MSKRLTYKYVRDYFKEHNCELLEKEYKNNSTKMEYRCECKNVSRITFHSFQRGRRCSKCGNNEKLTFEYVYNYFKNQGCELLDEKYVNNRTKMKYECNCGNISDICFNNFKQGNRCKKCSGLEKLTYRYVKRYFEERGCKLLEENYINNRTKMRYRCNCWNISKITFCGFQQGNRCNKCGTKRCAKKKRHTYEHIYNYFKEQGCELLEKDYTNALTKMRYKCNCGSKSTITFADFSSDRRCKKCGIEKRTGHNNHNYNPNLTDEDRKNRRLIKGYDQWVKDVYKKNNYTCQKCGCNSNRKNRLNAHHIDGYAENPNIRLDLNNGITFCQKCHMGFHYIYGKKNVNRKQLDNYFKMITLDT